MRFSYFENVYFFTATILNWQNLLSDDRMKTIIVQSLKYMSSERCRFLGFVIMPNHIHILLEFKNDSKENFQRDFLKYSAQRFIQIMRNEDPSRLKSYQSTQKDRKYQIWERRPLWVKIDFEEKFNVKLNYIHHNPISGKWKLSDSTEAYKWSSAAFHAGLENEFEWLEMLDH